MFVAHGKVSKEAWWGKASSIRSRGFFGNLIKFLLDFNKFSSDPASSSNIYEENSENLTKLSGEFSEPLELLAFYDLVKYFSEKSFKDRRCVTLSENFSPPNLSLKNIFRIGKEIITIDDIIPTYKVIWMVIF